MKKAQNLLKAAVVIAIALAFIMPSAAVITNIEQTNKTSPESYTIPARIQKADVDIQKLDKDAIDTLFNGDIPIANTEFDEQYCAIVEDPNDVLWAFFITAEDALSSDFYMARSTDDGSTWPDIWFFNIDGTEVYPTATIDQNGFLWLVFVGEEEDIIYFMQHQDTSLDPLEWELWYFSNDPDITDHRQVGDVTTMIVDDRVVVAWCNIEDIDWSGQGYEYWPGQATIEHDGGAPEEYTFTWDPTYQNCQYPSISSSDTYFYFAFQYPDELNGTTRINVRWGDATQESDMELWKNLWGAWNSPETYNCTKPAVSGSGSNIIVVYESSEAGNKDIVCSYTTDDAETWTHNIAVVDSAEDEENPRVFIAGDAVTVLYTMGGDLYSIKSSDAGATWSDPLQINDDAGTVENTWRTAELYKQFCVWTSNGAGNLDLLFDIIPTEAPWAPELTGPAEVKVNEETDFSAQTTDPQDDDIQYEFDWGDGTTSGWLSAVASGTEVTEGYTWTEQGEYEVKVRAKDTNDNIGEWSEPLPITVPRSKEITQPRFLEILEQFFPEIYRIIENLLG